MLTSAQIDALETLSWAQIAKLAKRAMAEIALYGVSNAMSGRQMTRVDVDGLQRLYDYATAQEQTELDGASGVMPGAVLAKLGDQQ